VTLEAASLTQETSSGLLRKETKSPLGQPILLIKRNQSANRTTPIIMKNQNENNKTTPTPTLTTFTKLDFKNKNILKSPTPTLTNDSMTTSSRIGFNKGMSISENDLTTKRVKLPPVSINSSSLNVSGSTNNLATINVSMNEGVNVKKKNDMSRYCTFCHRKTGLVSSYTCRFDYIYII
jgi:hypothetical protein